MRRAREPSASPPRPSAAEQPTTAHRGPITAHRRKWRTLSLQARVLIAAAVLLVCFVVFTSLTLERAFRDSGRSAREARLLGQLYLLMAAAEVEDEQLILPDALDEPLFSLPGSGLYAQVSDTQGRAVWRSTSSLGLEIPFVTGLSPGETRFEQRQASPGRAYLVEGFGVLWATGPVPQPYTFSVAEDQAELQREVARFRASLAGGMGVTSVLLLLALLALMRWGLRPLHRVATEVSAIEAGRSRRLEGDYPSELRMLTDNLNALLANGEARQVRLGNALGDLAHSLKTPLAVMRETIAQGRVEAEQSALMYEQIARMSQIIEYQLQRARAGTPGGTVRTSPVRVRPAVERIGGALAKIYRARQVGLSIAIDDSATFRGAEDDLMEVLGNLLDNAYKWCREQVRISAQTRDRQLLITVEDDGIGIAPELSQRLLERGARADETAPGHGIGLSVVLEISRAYGGHLRIDRSDLGGALVQVWVPA